MIHIFILGVSNLKYKDKDFEMELFFRPQIWKMCSWGVLGTCLGTSEWNLEFLFFLRFSFKKIQKLDFFQFLNFYDNFPWNFFFSQILKLLEICYNSIFSLFYILKYFHFYLNIFFQYRALRKSIFEILDFHQKSKKNQWKSLITWSKLYIFQKNLFVEKLHKIRSGNTFQIIRNYYTSTQIPFRNLFFH